MIELHHPLRIAIVGAGPAGFFATAELLRHQGLSFHVDLFDRLPTPFGLVRHGVAPDHQNIKSITTRYSRDAEAGGSRFRLFGNVEIGRDISVDELRQRYHAVVLAFGAQSNRRLDIPGEELRGVHPASVFVGWYNGHPDCVEARYDLSAERAVVVGMGNVALDVARMLATPLEELARTDMSDVALRALRESRIREIVILGRQSQAQATYTPLELEELTRIPGCDLVVDPVDRRLDPDSEASLAAGTLEPRIRKNIQVVSERALPEPRPGRKMVRLRFFATPVAILGEERIRAVQVDVQPSPESKAGQQLKPVGHLEEIECGALFRSIGYKIAPLPGVPFDEKTSTVPHHCGQVLAREAGQPLPGLFITGWAKRGPQGVIGTNKPDAAETVATLLQALERGGLVEPQIQEAEIELLLAERAVHHVTYSDWKLLDQLELDRGKEESRPRRKFTDTALMLQAIGNAKMASVPHLEIVARKA
jgi:ferredoxin--NADP+ reductase